MSKTPTENVGAGNENMEISNRYPCFKVHSKGDQTVEHDYNGDCYHSFFNSTSVN